VAVRVVVPRQRALPERAGRGRQRCARICRQRRARVSQEGIPAQKRALPGRQSRPHARDRCWRDGGEKGRRREAPLRTRGRPQVAGLMVHGEGRESRQVSRQEGPLPTRQELGRQGGGGRRMNVLAGRAAAMGSRWHGKAGNGGASAAGSVLLFAGARQAPPVEVCVWECSSRQVWQSCKIALQVWAAAVQAQTKAWKAVWGYATGCVVCVQCKRGGGG